MKISENDQLDLFSELQDIGLETVITEELINSD